MKQTLQFALVICLGVFFSVASVAQNTFPSSGPVGINTTIPSTALDVHGNINIGDNSGNNTYRLEFADAGDFNHYIYSSGTGGNNMYFGEWLAGQTNWGFHWIDSGYSKEVMTLNGLGYLGIGNTNPSAPLTVYAGTNNIAPSLTYGSTAAFSFQSAQVELAGGVATTSPWAYWLQARSDTNTAWTLALNPVGGNVGIGTTAPGAKLEVDGNIKLTAGSGASITFPDGSVQSTAYTGVTCGGDYAESVDVSGDRTHYEPGDVIVIDTDSPGRFLKSSEPYSTSVTGVYSTKPGVVGRRQTTDPKLSKSEIPMAMVGIVPTKVNAEGGPIHLGDLLVTSSTIGYAMKGTDRSRMLGAVIGKALGNLDSG